MGQSISSSPVIGSQFIANHEINLIVSRCCSGDLVITNTKNKIMLTIRSCDTSFHRQRLLLDERERPIATLRAKNITAHARWNVFRGESIDDSDMIFSATTNHMIQTHTHVNVSLANKTSRSDDCDFQIIGNWSNRNCDIYKRDSSIITIAQMNPGNSQEKFMVKIDANVDYAFVVALIAILDAIESPGTKLVVGVATKLAVGVAGVAAQIVAADILSHILS